MRGYYYNRYRFIAGRKSLMCGVRSLPVDIVQYREKSGETGALYEEGTPSRGDRRH